MWIFITMPMPSLKVWISQLAMWRIRSSGLKKDSTFFSKWFPCTIWSNKVTRQFPKLLQQCRYSIYCWFDTEHLLCYHVLQVFCSFFEHHIKKSLCWYVQWISSSYPQETFLQSNVTTQQKCQQSDVQEGTADCQLHFSYPLISCQPCYRFFEAFLAQGLIIYWPSRVCVCWCLCEYFRVNKPFTSAVLSRGK